MHRPVMLDECLEALLVRPQGVYVDGTLGGGGHAAAILERLAPGGRLIGFDCDEEAVKRAEDRLKAPEGVRVDLVHDNFANMAVQLDRLGVEKVDGVLLDLGVSSFQLDEAERGFSFLRDGPLDMRMNRGEGRSAADLVNHLSEQELADLIFRYGEERAARRIARAIVRERDRAPITSTLRLAEIVAAAAGGRRGRRIHPATRTFQALRMAVNDELANIERVLEEMIGRIAVGGRMVVLTFHSLEDRLVKRFFARHEPREESLPQGGVRKVFEEPPVRRLWKKPRTASEAERRENPRARSAKLRAAEVIAE